MLGRHPLATTYAHPAERRRTRSDRASAPSTVCVLAFALGMIIGVLAVITYAYVWEPSQTTTTAPVTYLSSVGTIADGGNVQIYVWSDPDSHRDYLVPVYKDSVGGMCERNLEVIPVG